MDGDPLAADRRLALALAVRPARLGLLVPTSFPRASWIGLFEAALAAQTGFWGGAANVIFPLTADLTDRDLFWEIADRFDADGFLTYTPTWADVEDFAPREYAAHMGALRADVERRHDVEMASQAVDSHRQDLALIAEPTTGQLDLVRRRLAPFHRTDSSWMADTFSGTGAISWPYTDAAEFRELPADPIHRPPRPR